jgi:hypothetical protein
METADVHGPIDFVLIEFHEDRLTGGAAQALLDVVEAGIVTLYDVLVVGKADDGNVYAIDLDDAGEQVGSFSDLAWVRRACSPRRTCGTPPARWRRARSRS